MSDLYDTDFVLWSERQADALRRRASNEVDWDNVAEEIESLSRSDKREIRNRLEVLLHHLLKWVHQPEQHSSRWRGTITEQRRRVRQLVDESPTLRPYPAAKLAEAFEGGREAAQIETGLSNLPQVCPWTIEQVLDPAFWPGPPP
jgi:hypothetical protein